MESILKFLRTAYELHQVIYGMLEEYGLSKGKFTILIIMYAEAREEGINPSELAEKAGVSRATITGLLSRLERDCIIERKSDLHDGRMTNVRLSASGIDLMNKVLPLHFVHTSRLMSGLSEQEHTLLESLLQKIRAGISI